MFASLVEGFILHLRDEGILAKSGIFRLNIGAFR
jgi:hypothetical protein